MVGTSPHRLAWIVLLASFLTCCGLTIGVPAAAMSFVNSTTYAPAISVKLQAGRTIAFDPPATEADARVVGQEGRVLEEGSTVIVDGDVPSQALMTFDASDGVTTTLASVQLYSGARLRIERARIPRFAIATTPIQITIRLLSGRVQIQKQPRGTAAHDVQFVVGSEHMTAVLDPGAYSLEVLPDVTSLFVREGSAQVTSVAKPETYNIEANQRTIIMKGGGVLPGAPPRDLIRNGHFQQSLGKDWDTFAELQVPGEVTGTFQALGTGSDASLLIDRPGANLHWGRTGIQQTIDENVSGRTSLQLRIKFAILYQELRVCSGQGSECPLMVKVNYQNKEGGVSEWTQGFYADGTPQMPDLPDFIVQAPEPRTKHIAANLGQTDIWESANLIQALGDVQNINYIQVYAEGHGVRTQIYSVELLVLD